MIIRKNAKEKRCGIKNVLVVLLVLVLLSVIPVSAAFEDDEIVLENPGVNEEGEQFLPPEELLKQVETDRSGTIEIQLTEGKKGTSVSGILFYCIRVADIVGGEYELLEEYHSSGVNFHEIQNSNQLDSAAIKLDTFVSEKIDLGENRSEVIDSNEIGSKENRSEVIDSNEIGSGEGSSKVMAAVTDSQGHAVFENLEVGVYLIKAEDQESYDVVTPVLLAVPTWDEEIGEMSYEILVEPKHTPRPDIPAENEAPQANLKDHTRLYIGLAGACILLALVVMLAGRERKGTGAKRSMTEE